MMDILYNRGEIVEDGSWRSWLTQRKDDESAAQHPYFRSFANLFEADLASLSNGLFRKMFLGSTLAWYSGHGFLVFGEESGEVETRGVPCGVLKVDPEGEFGKLTNCCGAL